MMDSSSAPFLRCSRCHKKAKVRENSRPAEGAEPQQYLLVKTVDYMGADDYGDCTTSVYAGLTEEEAYRIVLQSSAVAKKHGGEVSYQLYEDRPDVSDTVFNWKTRLAVDVAERLKQQQEEEAVQKAKEAAKQKGEQDARDRAEYERLKAKFGNDPAAEFNALLGQVGDAIKSARKPQGKVG
jgi:hypothetical protein